MSTTFLNLILSFEISGENRNAFNLIRSKQHQHWAFERSAPSPEAKANLKTIAILSGRNSKSNSHLIGVNANHLFCSVADVTNIAANF
jgi:hypothetical protein